MENYISRRNSIISTLAPSSIFVLYSGEEHHVSADCYDLFTAQCNKNFFYLTGLRRENMALLINNCVTPASVTLFIEEADPLKERWYGKKVTKEEAKAISGIESIRFISELDSVIGSAMTMFSVENAYFDCYRHSMDDLPDYNLYKATEFGKRYPGVQIRNMFPAVAKLRMTKDEREIGLVRKAIELTKLGLENMMKNLKPGEYEYQAQADFEYSIRRNGAEWTAFPTIAASGLNATMLHYETNQCEIKDGSLLLLDLGARYEGYNADITRTYPANGKFSDRQRKVYDIVLAANRKVLAEAKPGMTTKQLNDICKDVLAKGCIELGLIEKPEDIGKYYMHGVSHHLGIDVHDVSDRRDAVLTEGAIITDEPGLYIDEWEIGIRIEDDLLITKDGAICLSEDIIRTPEEIEAFMK